MDNQVHANSTDQNSILNNVIQLNQNDSTINIPNEKNEDLLEVKEDCICQEVTQPDFPIQCKKCQGEIVGIKKLKQDNKTIKLKLNEGKQMMIQQLKQLESEIKEKHAIQRQFKKKQEQLDTTIIKLEEMKVVKNVIGIKLINEFKNIERIQSDPVNERQRAEREILELTESLKNEYKLEHAEKLKSLEKLRALTEELTLSKQELQKDQTQMTVLRKQISKFDHHNDKLKYQLKMSMNTNNEAPFQDFNSQSIIDPLLWNQFKEMIDCSPKIKKSIKFYQLTYLKNALEDDVLPCLRFGGNPLTSTQNLLDSILRDTISIQELSTPISFSKNKSRNDPIEEALVSIFKMTIFEKFNKVISPTNRTFEADGCTTCGRREDYRYQFKINGSVDEAWYPLCQNCKSRIMAVSNFYRFIKLIRDDDYKQYSNQELYFHTLVLRQKMFYTRSVLYPSDKVADCLSRKNSITLRQYSDIKVLIKTEPCIAFLISLVCNPYHLVGSWVFLTSPLMKVFHVISHIRITCDFKYGITMERYYSSRLSHSEEIHVSLYVDYNENSKYSLSMTTFQREFQNWVCFTKLRHAQTAS
ncbi:hypothetical protein BC833DRAFT_564449 [Globomyces pollinis-pini]|nr:hypothetical protein BC833DRAFT_564449 [Globomyces pollinis-pini]